MDFTKFYITKAARFNWIINNVKVCFSYSPGNTNQQLYLLLATGGACEQAIIGAGKYNFSDFVYNNIFTNPEKQNIILTSSGLKKLPDYFNKMTRLSGQDYDNDGIADPNELNLELVTFEEDSTIVYPSFEKIAKDYYGLFYVEQGLARLERDLETKVHNYMRFVKIMPIKSDPTEADGDLDGIPDILDKAPLSESQIPKAFKDLIVNRVVKYDSVVRMSDNCYVCYEPLHKLVDSSIVTDYVLSNGNLTLEDIILIQNCLSESSNDIGSLCLAGTYVGKDEMYFVAPTDATDMELSVMASSNADYHRQQIIQSSELQNDIGYRLLKDYSEKISSVVNEQDTAFNNGLDFFYNSGEQMKLLGFYDEESIINIGSLRDSINKCALRFVYQLACLVDKEHIKSAITTTTVSYIEYSYWYRQQDPGSSGFEQVGSYIGNAVDKTCDYIILDINDRLMNGTPESRGEFLGECLFDICLDVAIGKIAGDFLDSRFASETLDDLDDVKTRFGTNPVDNPEQFEVVDVYLDYEGKGYSYNVTSSQAKKIKKYIVTYQNSFRTAVVKLNGKYLDDLIDLTERHGDDFLRLLNNSTEPTSLLDGAKLADNYLINNQIVDVGSQDWKNISKYYEQVVNDFKKTIQESGGMLGRNNAYTEIKIVGQDVRNIKASSNIKSPDGFAEVFGDINQSTDSNRFFKTEWLDDSGNIITGETANSSFNRCVDTEARTFEQIARELDLKIDPKTGMIVKNDAIVGTINMFTERKPCASCKKVIEQFKEAFPNITINIYWIE